MFINQAQNHEHRVILKTVNFYWKLSDTMLILNTNLISSFEKSTDSSKMWSKLPSVTLYTQTGGVLE